MMGDDDLGINTKEEKQCYYLAVENNAGEFCVFGIILDKNAG